jgi:hypothetical protein
MANWGSLNQYLKSEEGQEEGSEDKEKKGG